MQITLKDSKDKLNRDRYVFKFKLIVDWLHFAKLSFYCMFALQKEMLSFCCMFALKKEILQYNWLIFDKVMVRIFLFLYINAETARNLN